MKINTGRDHLMIFCPNRPPLLNTDEFEKFGLFGWVKRIIQHQNVQMTPSPRGQWKVLKWWGSAQGDQYFHLMTWAWGFQGFQRVCVCMCARPVNPHRWVDRGVQVLISSITVHSLSVQEQALSLGGRPPRGNQSDVRGSGTEEQLCLVQVWCPPRSIAVGTAWHGLSPVSLCVFVSVYGSQCQAP